MTAPHRDADDWRDRAACKANPDLWFSTIPAEQRQAIHICLRHCPVYTPCRADRASCPYGIKAGILYAGTQAAKPSSRQPKPRKDDCPTCHPGAKPRPVGDRKEPLSRSNCGTPAGYRQHYGHGEYPCETCRVSERERKRRHPGSVRGASRGEVAA